MKKEERDELILAALISNPTTKAASEACGVSCTQIYERLRNPDFKARYDRLRQEMLEECANSLQHRMVGAIEGIWEIAENDDFIGGVSDQTRLNAYSTILREGIRLNRELHTLKNSNNKEKTENEN